MNTKTTHDIKCNKIFNANITLCKCCIIKCTSCICLVFVRNMLPFVARLHVSCTCLSLCHFDKSSLRARVYIAVLSQVRNFRDALFSSRTFQIRRVGGGGNSSGRFYCETYRRKFRTKPDETQTFIRAEINFKIHFKIFQYYKMI